MALATQCPYCHTAFRVANDQLKLHAGLVRCGACQQTFNGIEHLLSPGQATVALIVPPVVPANTEAATQVAPAVAQAFATIPTPVTSSAAPAVSVSPQANTTHLASASALEFDMGEFELNAQTEVEADSEAAAKSDAEASSSPELALDAEVHDLELEIRSTLMNQEDADWSINTAPKGESEFELASAAAIAKQARKESALERKEPHFTSDENEQSAANESTSDELNPDSANQNGSNDDENNGDENQTHLEKPDFVVKAEKQKNRSRALRYLMLFFSFLLLLSLLAQTTYSARDMIAAWFPQTKPTLQKLCVTLHCQIALPSQIDMITIESNELEALETGSKVFSLALQLQNKSSTLQNWPMLELILNDAKGKVLVQKAFAPSQYLSKQEDISKGFAAGSEQTVKLFFESTAGKASAYHVGVFYP